MCYGKYNPDDFDADVYIIYGSLIEFSAEIKAAKEIRRTKPNAVIGFIGTFPTMKSEYYITDADFIIKRIQTYNYFYII